MPATTITKPVAAALAGCLTGGAFALTLVVTVGINQALALKACRAEAALARISAEHCTRR